MFNVSNYNSSSKITDEEYKKLIELLNSKYTVDYLYYLNRTKKFHYRKKTIQKKSGSIRTLYVPDNNLKNVQRLLLTNHLEKLPISEFATAYHKGANLINNAYVHTNKKAVLKLDISDFFSSINEDTVYLCAFNKKYFSPSIGKLLASLCCYKGAIVQGSPSSPAIANIVMKSFDEKIGRWCSERNIFYTRYCDDMTFSGEFSKNLVINKVRKMLEAMNLYLNDNKTIFIPQNKQQKVTGIVVNKKINTSSDYRKEIRKEIYYCKKYGVSNHLKFSKLHNEFTEESYINHLKGKVNYVLMINPENKEFIEYKNYLKSLQKSKLQ